MRPDAPRARGQLAERLTTIRKVAGVRIGDLAAALRVSEGQISKYGNGTRLLDEAQLATWLELCRVTDPAVRRELDELLEEAHARTIAWRAAMRDGSAQHIVRDRLDAARLVCAFNPARVPGLLQTEAYARLVFTRVGAPGIDVERSVAGRMGNQAALREGGRRFVFVLGERVLRRDYGDPPMLDEQVARIGAVSELDAVEVYVLPDRALVPEIPFTLYDDPVGDAEPLVSIELPFRGHVVDGPDEVARYRDLFTRLRDAATPWESPESR